MVPEGYRNPALDESQQSIQERFHADRLKELEKQKTDHAVVILALEESKRENARLRRQVERLKQWDAVFRDGYLCGLMEKVPQDVGCFDESEMQWSWDKSTAKTLRDAILADEPDAATAIDKTPPDPENNAVET